MHIKNKNLVWVLSLFVIVVVSNSAYRINNHIKLKKMIGQMVMVGFRGTIPQDSEVQDMEDDVAKGNIGGVIEFSSDFANGIKAGLSGSEIRKQTKSRNIISTKQVKKLNKYFSDAASRGGQPALFIAIDQEGGPVSRLMPEHGFTATLPSEKEMAKKYTPQQAEEQYKKMGQAIHSLGFNLDFSPVVDIDINPDNPAIGALGRSFSSDPKLVTEYARAAMKGLIAAHVLYSFKHFPGHGSSKGDTHKGIVDVTKTWSDKELIPYYELVKTNMPGTVMVAHITNMNLDSKYPASMSYKIIDGILRKKIGFNGVVISDDLQMGAISEQYNLSQTLYHAIMAGNDVLLFGNNLVYTRNLGRIVQKEILKLVNSGKISKERIKQSYDRIIKLKQKIK